ncbi:Ribonuclease H domain [Arabidopsis thaliana x Arabidopsis arenosa]|uniref:Ribonuclease H domain n=1 Tax=Arabidopsis thaliana x Arabidopsis arenosa TaxID=1240361 RepID=A0A8T2A4P8_9BRAS|nr:Ribonuclease H domain [Arabidopsis thaliana x Arabidopsis arenosa]
MINDCRLREVPSIGNSFSWAGERNKMWIQCRLDRALGNTEWFHLFPRVQVEYLDRIGSDHRPILTRFTNENMSRFGRFMFNKRWISKPDFAEIVKNGWAQGDISGYGSLMNRISECRRAISIWKKETNQNSQEKISVLRDKLDKEGSKLNPDLTFMRVLRWDLAEAYREEELFWKQKSHEKWLKEGDRNTRFFHGSVQRRRIQNRIISLLDSNGIEQFAEASKGEIAVDYFRLMFTSSNPDAISESLEGMLPRVTSQMNSVLTRTVTSEEIRAAVFSIKGDSTPGADGMSGHFYQNYWDIVGPQVVEEVKQFFSSGTFPAEWNFTQLCLLPKVPNPAKMTDLRPISLCSVLYKIISKILCNRLKQFLPVIVSDTQGAFVSGRLISDNILLAHEMVHALRTNAGCDEEFLAIKTDMSKAYDRAESEGRLTGMRLTPNCPSVQHLLFADDSLFLCRATFKECSEFLNCLKLYGQASGQEINFQKSAITFGKKLDPYMRRLIGLYTGIEQEGGEGKYLGLPECFSGSKRDLLNFITDRLKSRLSGWYEKTLSLGGKEVLLKSVAMALPVYAMSCFRLTKHQCKQITSAMTNFWWNECEEKNKMHWVSWEKICKSKKQGGLGFRDIGRFNQALLAKQAWRLLDTPQSLLCQVYKARYFAKKTFMEAKIGYRPSYAWRSIMFGRELLERGVMKTIGNGQDTYVWADKWILDTYPRRPINKELMMDIDLKVSALITPQGSWNRPLLASLIPEGDVIKICSFPPALHLQDRFVWAYTSDGRYTVKSGNWVLNRECTAIEVSSGHSQELNKLKEKIWDIPTAPKIKLFLWRVLSGALAVAECLRHHGLQISPICQLCKVAEETVSHVLFGCSLAAQVWDTIGLPFPTQGFSDVIGENIGHVLSLMAKSELPIHLRQAIPWILWGIWKARNSTLYADRVNDHNVLIASAIEEAEEWTQQNNILLQEMHRDNQRHKIMVQRWLKPAVGVLKCNIHTSWINEQSFCGGAWILRDHTGHALLHARDAFTPMVNRIAAELHGIYWCLQSLLDLHFHSCEIWSDCGAAIAAITSPSAWPKYRSQLDKIATVIRVMRETSFKLSPPKANLLARDIACSVTRDGRFNSYLASGGPAWLHERIERDRLARS